MWMLAAVYFLLFVCLAWKNFRSAVFLFILLLPSYLIRFEVFYFRKIVFPSTVLELSFGALFLVWLIKYSREDIKKIITASKKHVWFFIVFDLFFLSSVISIFVSDMPIPSLGEWRAYFLEPMIFFLILVGRQISIYNLNSALAISTLSISLYAVAQKFTGWGIATPEWVAESTRRVTAFYSSPNAVGLYLAPVAMILLFIIYKMRGNRNRNFWLASMICLLSLAALIFTKSQGAWIGLGAGLLVFLFFIGYKKIVAGLAIAGVIFSLAAPSMRQAVLFQDQANQNRLRLWGYSWTFLKQSPNNFVLGTGVRQFFRKVQKPYYDKMIMERLIYPHNIFLNFWTEIGLLGMLAAVIILGYAFYLSNKIRQADKIMGAGLMAALTVLVVHGLVDVPYFKNDLAFLFWILIASVFIIEMSERNSQ
ncbi:MAG: O-antigen ligase family protein [Candidatus Magasanikbacteria bacterium]|nr:O-antigen ligase family protein [Candidatus Magasanikbacteria bacterium]